MLNFEGHVATALLDARVAPRESRAQSALGAAVTVISLLPTSTFWVKRRQLQEQLVTEAALC